MDKFVNDKIDRKLSFYVIFFFIVQALNGTIKNILPFLTDNLQSKISIIFGILLLILMGRGFKYIITRSGSMLLISYGAFIALYTIGILQSLIRADPVDLLIGYSALWTFVWWIPMGLFVYSIRDISILYKTLLKGSYLLAGILLLNILPILFGIDRLFGDGKEYNMFLSYMLVFPLLLHLNEYLYKNSTLLLMIISVELLVIVLYGSRGTLLCLFSFIGLKILFSCKNPVKTFLMLLLGLFLSLVFLSFSSHLVQFLAEYGIESRTLAKLSAGEAFLQGRSNIWTAAINLIEQRPFFGYGLGGEFYQMTYEAYALSGGYYDEVQDLTPHQGFLQLMLNFGVIIGSIVGVYLLGSILKLKYSVNYQTEGLIMVIYSVFVIPAMTISDGIFTKPGIAIYLYLIINYRKRCLYEKN